jgi:hypothetical protein
VLVHVGHRGDLVGGGGELAQPAVGEVGPVGVAPAPAHERAHAHAAAGGVGQALHAAVVDADLALHGALGVGVGVLGAGGQGGVDRPPRDGLEVERLAHASVPPTVSAAIRTCG